MKPKVSFAASAVPRRGLVIGVGVAGAAALVAGKLTGGSTPAAETGIAGKAAAKPEGAAGYRLTEHVLRYYQTTRV